MALLTPRVGDGESGHDWARPAVAADTAVLSMAGRQAELIAAGLIAAGMPASRPVVLVENASLPQRSIVATRLAGLAAAAARMGDGPVLMLVGEVYEDHVRRADVEAAAALPVLLRQGRVR